MTNFKETTEDMIGHIGEFHLRDEEKKRVAYYLAGQIVVWKSNPVLQQSFLLKGIKMVPSKRSLGSIIFLPGDGFRLPTKESLLAEIEFRLAGKITEEIIYGKKGVSTLGALDLNHVVGMLTINKIIVGSKGRGAEDTAKIIENIIKECENKVRETLMSQRDKLERLAQVILEKQDISIKEIDALGIF